MKPTKAVHKVGDIVYRRINVESNQVNIVQASYPPGYVVIKIVAETVDNKTWLYKYLLRGEFESQVIEAFDAELMSRSEVELQRKLIPQEDMFIKKDLEPYILTPAPKPIKISDSGTTDDQTRKWDTTGRPSPITWGDSSGGNG